ncbi:MAG TPA: GtrA family protein [Bacilli bacterium]|nr:GtrA family protein [Bacilli bacterium]
MKKILTNKPLMYEIVRFVIVGGVATLVDFVIASLFQYLIYTSSATWLILGLIPITASVFVSTIMGFTFGVIVNYVLSILVVFKDLEDKKKSRSVMGFIIFVALGTIGFLINLAIKEVGNMIHAFEGNFFWFAFVFAFATLIVLIYNYISRKLILFRPSKKEEDIK